MTHQLTIDLITKRPDGAVVLVLVEQGPWDSCEIVAQLRRVQDRLYDCVDAAIDGHLAVKYPDSQGRPVVIRLDCYDTPDQDVCDFIQRFSEHVTNSDEIQRGMAAQGFVQSLEFEYNWRPLNGHNENEKGI
jgi:hypothetical protein